MSSNINIDNIFKNIYRKSGKVREHNSLSPNMRPSSNQNKKKTQNQNQKYQNSTNILTMDKSLNVNNFNTNVNMINNNFNFNTNSQNHNIKVNKAKYVKKEKIYEGELIIDENNNKNIANSKISNDKNIRGNLNKNSNTKHGTKISRKSPIPVPKNYKPDLYNTNKQNQFKITFNNSVTSKLLKGGRQDYNNQNNHGFILNFKNNVNNIDNNLFQNKNLKSSKVKSNNNLYERSYSPILREDDINKNLLFNNKGIKKKHVSKSPVIINKNSILNKFKNLGFNNFIGLNMGTNNINNIFGLKKYKNSGVMKSLHPPSSNLNNKKIQNVNVNNKKKQNIVISGEIMENKETINLHKINNTKIINKDTTSKTDFNNNNNNINNNININNNVKINNFINNNNCNLNSDISKCNFQKSKNKNEFLDVKFNQIKDKLNNQNELIENSEEVIDLKKQLKNNNSTPQLFEKNNSQIIIQKDKKINSDIDLIAKDNQKENNKLICKKIKDIFTFSHVGFDGEKNKENNQDNYFIYKNFAGHDDYLYLSVCDGHGVEGHYVSRFIKEVLPVDMSENLKLKDIINDTHNIHKIIKETFLIANDKLVEAEDINSLFSGSTCVSVIYTPQKLIVPNIGDSRAVLATTGTMPDGSLGIVKVTELSRDHKPTEKDEAERIFENDGRIQPFLEEGEFVGPERVWVKEDEVPGLAMTRSFGDRVAATVGVISEPEIKEFNFNKGDSFMLIASDGVWEFINSDECMQIIFEFYKNDNMDQCCEFLYQESKKRWLREEEVIDDITMILIVFQ